MKRATFDAYVRRLVYEKPTPAEVAAMYNDVFINAGEKRLNEFENLMRRLRIPKPEGYASVTLVIPDASGQLVPKRVREA